MRLESVSTHTHNLKTKVLNVVLVVAQIFLHTNRFIWGQQRIEIQGFATMVSQMHTQQGKENSFMEGREISKLQETESWFSLAETLQGGEDASFSPCWALLSSQGSLFWPLNSNWFLFIRL